MTMSASFHMRPDVVIKTEQHRNTKSGYLLLTPTGDSIYPSLSVHGGPTELRRLAAAAVELAERCERFSRALAES